MRRVRLRTHPATSGQPADAGAVPGQRGAQGGGYPEPDEYGRGEGSGTAEYRQAEGRRGGARGYGEPTGYRPVARQRYYGLAGVLMVLSGLLTFFIGITGIIRGIFFNRVATFPFYYSVRSRGVTLLVIGVVAFLVGLALLIYLPWARKVAAVVAVVSAVANFMFLPFYPFWSVIVLALNVLVIWDLMRERDRREFARLPAYRGGGAMAFVTGGPAVRFPM